MNFVARLLECAEVARERRRIAGNVGDAFGAEAGDAFGGAWFQAGARRIENDELRALSIFREEAIDVGGADFDRAVAAQVHFQVACGGGIGFDGDHAFEFLGERDGEKADSSEEIKSHAAGSFVLGNFAGEFVHQEFVHLKKGEVADAEGSACGFVVEKSRSEKLHAIASRIVKYEAGHFRDDFAERFGVFGGARWKSGERRGEHELGIGRVGEGFNFAEAARKFCGSERFAQREQSFEQQRRNDGAFFDGAKSGGVGLKISDAKAGLAVNGRLRSGFALCFEGTHFPLGAISVGPGRRGVRGDRSGPIDAPDAAQSFAENVGFEFELRFVGNLLVIAAAAIAEVAAVRDEAFGRRLQHLFEFRANEFLFLLDGVGADQFSGHHERNENRRAFVMRESFTAVNQFLDCYVHGRHSGRLIPFIRF